MNVYVFEDRQEQRLCEMFNKCYKLQAPYRLEYTFLEGKKKPKQREATVLDGDEYRFIYAEGNSKLFGLISWLNGQQEYKGQNVYVYIDVQPDNNETRNFYNKLIKFKNEFQTYIVLPIPCREYYYIKTLHGQKVETSKILQDTVLNRDVQYNNIQMQYIGKRCINFENFCKQVQYYAFQRCTQIKGIDNYFYTDCICSNTDGIKQVSGQSNDVQQCSLSEKVDDKLGKYIQSYCCVPSRNRLVYLHSMTVDEVWEMQRRLVDDYNAMVNRFLKTVDSSDLLSKYQTINYMTKEENTYGNQ